MEPSRSRDFEEARSQRKFWPIPELAIGAESPGSISAGNDDASSAGSPQLTSSNLEFYFNNDNIPPPVSDRMTAETAAVPSYLMPTVSSTLPPYQHGENERIRNSYRTATCWTIKKLPNRLEPGTIQSLRKKQTVENILLTDKLNFKPASRLKGYLFHPHQHITMNYEKTSYINKHVVDEEKQRTDSYSRKPFVVSSRVRFKFEDIFDNPNFVYPNMGPGGVKEDIQSTMRGDGSNKPGTQFSGRYDEEHGRLTHETQLLIQDWTRRIFKSLEADWKELTFRIRFTKSQELLIQFRKPDPPPAPAPAQAVGGVSEGGFSHHEGGDDQRRDTREMVAPEEAKPVVPFPPPNNALLKYMQHFARHGLGMELKLQKRGDRWNVMEIDPGHTPSDTGETWTSGGPDGDNTLTHGSQAGSVDPSVPAAVEGIALPLSHSHDVDEDGNRWYLGDGPGLSSRSGKGMDLPPLVTQPPSSASATAGGSRPNSQPGSGQGSAPSSTSVSPTGAQAVSREAIQPRDAMDASPRLGGSGSILPLGLPHPHHARVTRISSGPHLETMAEEQSQGSDSKGGGASGSYLHGSQDPRTCHQYLTFAFYAPWVTARQMHISKKTALRERNEARAYAEKRTRLYNPEKANRLYGREAGEEGGGMRNGAGGGAAGYLPSLGRGMAGGSTAAGGGGGAEDGGGQGHSSRLSSINPFVSQSLLSAINAVRDNYSFNSGSGIRGSIYSDGGNSNRGSFMIGAAATTGAGSSASVGSGTASGAGAAAGAAAGIAAIAAGSSSQVVNPSNSSNANASSASLTQSNHALVQRSHINGQWVAHGAPIRHLSRVFSNIDLDSRS